MAAGQLLAQVETADAQAALDAAEAGLQRAESELADLTHGSRPEELAALQASVTAARAHAARADADATREERLSARGVSSAAQSAMLRAAADVAQAALAEAQARLAAARLPARADRIAAARAGVAAARAARDTSRWQLDQRSIRADRAGVVTDIIRNPGEIASPSAPVLTCLPRAPCGCGCSCPNPRWPRGDSAQLLVEVDATDPAAASGAISTLETVAARALARELGAARAASAVTGPAGPEIIVHRRYNPKGLTLD